jgi:hypothetical protein
LTGYSKGTRTDVRLEVSRQDDSIDYLTTTLSLRAKRGGSYLHGAPSALAVRNRNYAVNQAVHTC